MYNKQLLQIFEQTSVNKRKSFKMYGKDIRVVVSQEGEIWPGRGNDKDSIRLYERQCKSERTNVYLTLTQKVSKCS